MIGYAFRFIELGHEKYKKTERYITAHRARCTLHSLLIHSGSSRGYEKSSNSVQKLHHLQNGVVSCQALRTGSIAMRYVVLIQLLVSTAVFAQTGESSVPNGNPDVHDASSVAFSDIMQPFWSYFEHRVQAGHTYSSNVDLQFRYRQNRQHSVPVPYLIPVGHTAFPDSLFSLERDQLFNSLLSYQPNTDHSNPKNIGDIATEYAALKALYKATNGGNWTRNDGWDTTLVSPTASDLGKYYGITIDNGSVSKIFLAQNNLTGRIPSQLSELTRLVHLDLEKNRLEGSIPAELGELSRLKYLLLSINRLTGGIPAQLGNLANLEEIAIDSNELSGGIPTELEKLSKLERINFSRNRLTGGIPSFLSKLTKLTNLVLGNNPLSGEIPPQLGDLTQLDELSLYFNGLTGGIPSELGKLTRLTRLWLFHNNLTGEIPSELGNLTLLNELQIYSNELTGGIPSQLGNLTGLTSLKIEKMHSVEYCRGLLPISTHYMIFIGMTTTKAKMMSYAPPAIRTFEPGLRRSEEQMALFAHCKRIYR